MKSKNPEISDSFHIAIDTGGTFTDCIALAPDGSLRTCKVLSNSTLRGLVIEILDRRTVRVQVAWQVERDIFKGYAFRPLNHPLSIKPKNGKFRGKILIKNYDVDRHILTFDRPLPADFLLYQNFPFEITANEEPPILAARLITQTALDEALPPMSFRLGTTRGTNALLERKGAPTAFITTEGFADVLTIGTQQRPDLFALNIQKPKPIYTEGVEILERLAADGSVLKPLTINDLEKKIARLKRRKIESVAVALMHSYRNPTHERQLKSELEKHFRFVSISSDMSGQIKFVPRAETTVVNAYLAPILHDYLKQIVAK